MAAVDGGGSLAVVQFQVEARSAILNHDIIICLRICASATAAVIAPPTPALIVHLTSANCVGISSSLLQHQPRSLLPRLAFENHLHWVSAYRQVQAWDEISITQLEAGSLSLAS